MRTVLKFLMNKKVRKYIWLALLAPALMSTQAQGLRTVNADTAWVSYLSQSKQVQVVKQERLSTSVAWGNLIAERA